MSNLTEIKKAMPRVTEESSPSSVTKQRQSKPSLTEQAYSQIEEAIVTLKLAPGTAVSEQMLSDMTGIGRTPIREAIQRLAREHLIFILPQRGLLIPHVDTRKQLKLLKTRREVERLICRSAAHSATIEERAGFARVAETFLAASKADDGLRFMRADREFNELSLIAARNEFAEGAMRLMQGLSRRFWYIHYKQTADLPEIARLHAAIAQAIADGEEQAAADCLDRLIDNIEEFTHATLLS
ncbi:GntR family transcriptional regulator [Castellaniella sp. FW104-16D08]|uniref:GntR family transcriptional regulator n=1 Tax=unclassified Castellaniella TaxID=2617606 RepID=UPI0033154C2B